ncbi:FtsK/SpoIIIE domain-containing protein [Nocardioides massiliensis]|uniref:S-DNA-T family DNA segregation ATPase FtsK/SpoIIIE n=1 Tax=Nocardioides massiliensis TaxID=1325935 RepID=A0ABT9NK94_9ACTN|nr:FtsK/SpoIIIE domain-containing protein [Nocardioides massiliensis]MDP9820637.1 S-DNA-T family DNA segregation ATPase FtsK/SpoIIIE [Nocardioides massiliensis]
MRVEVTVIDPHWGVHEDVVIDADDATPVAEVIEQLVRVLATPGTETPELAVAGGADVISLASRRSTPSLVGTASGHTLYHRGEPLDPEVALADSGLKTGSLLSLDDPVGSILDEPEGLVEVRVVSGTGAGSVHRLSFGEASIGSDPGCVVVLEDPRVPPTAVELTISLDGTVEVRAAEGAADVLAEALPSVEVPLALDREPLSDEPATWEQGAQLTVGTVLLELEAVTRPDAAVEDSPDPGWVDYNRPPRLFPPDRKTQFKLPTVPQEHNRGGLPWIVMLMPMVAAVSLALILNRWYMLMMGFFSPIMMLGSWLQGRKTGKLTYRKQMAEYREKKASIEADAAQALVDERQARRNEAPDPALALLIATGPRVRLWERRTDDPDYLSLRIGIGDLESEVVVEDPEQLEHKRKTIRTAYDVPVTVPLRERGVVGIAGGGDLPRRIASWFVAQIAVLQSPRDSQVYVLTDTDNADAWDWLRWLPHARPQNGQDTVVTLGTDAETCARRIAELSSMLGARQKAAGQRSGAPGRLGPDIVVVIDGARRLRSLPGVVALLKQGPTFGIRAICLDREERLLPEEATAVVVETPDGVTLRQQRVTVVDRIVPDQVDQLWLSRVSRALAPVRDISGGDSDSVLPNACRLVEVMEIEPPTPEVIKARWAVMPRSTEAVIGISLDGPFAIDMRRDGPHGLIAGTTGAGKSELLQSIVASLAVSNRPDGMTFVLVDYKGGAAFKDCVDLPHTVGMVTDLDTHLVERALVSLGAELTRREHILADAGAKDIEDYVDLMAKRPELVAMPRLLIVIDEFASLARELPDFVTGLVNVAQRGRSLGIHLILATQRPGGVVSPEIRANTNLRIALRVTDGSESTDVIDSPEAGRIAKSTPGRAYVRLGANSLVPFQSGRVGGRRPGTVVKTEEPPWMTPLTLQRLPQPIPTKPKVEAVDDAEITDLTVLVDAIRQANDQLGLPAQHSPWLPSLTTDVQLDDLLAEVAPTVAPALPAFPYGVEDLPAEQARRHSAIDFATFSHLAIVGGPRSGRSQALRTMAVSVASLASPADVHVYGLDCGNGALLPLAELPHCGAVVQRTQTDRATRLLSRLSAEVSRRQELLAEGGYADLGELRASVADPADRLPHILLLLDRWEGFLGSLSELDGGAPHEQIQALLREGASVGIHLVIAGDRQLVNARMGSLIEDKIGLRLPDRGDYAMMSLQARKLPEDIPEGRGFRSESAIELQFALLGPDPSGQAQAAAVRAAAAAAKEKYADVPRALRPFRVDVLPNRITFEDAWALRHEEAIPGLWAMVGVGGDELTAVGFDLERTPAAIIAGPSRSGRSTALLCAVESLLRGGAEVVIAAPRPSPLRQLEGREGIRAVLTDSELSEEMLAPVLDEGEGPVVLVVDDGELLKDIPAKNYLKSFARTAADNRRAIILGGDSAEVGGGFSGWQVDLKGRQGLLISPQSITDGELIGVRVPRSALGNAATSGRAMVNDGDGTLRTIQVALPDITG